MQTIDKKEALKRLSSAHANYVSTQGNNSKAFTMTN